MRAARHAVLVLIFFSVALCAAQTKTAIDRMNERVAEWQKAPTDRFVGFEVAFPTASEPVTPQHKPVMLLVTVITKEPQKDYVSNLSISAGDHKLQLTTLGTAKAPYLADPSMTREDYIYNLPVATANGDFELVVALGWPATMIDLGRLPAWSPSVVKTNEPSPTGSTPSLADSLKEAFPGLALQSAKVRISSGVAQRNLVRQVRPAYPAEAKKAHISGVVVLAVNITREGKVQNIRVISGPKELVDSAVDAVRQWEYTPYILNGDPAEVETTVTINFSLGG